MQGEEVESAAEQMVWTRREEWAKEINVAVILSTDTDINSNKNFTHKS